MSQLRLERFTGLVWQWDFYLPNSGSLDSAVDCISWEENIAWKFGPWLGRVKSCLVVLRMIMMIGTLCYPVKAVCIFVSMNTCLHLVIHSCCFSCRKDHLDSGLHCYILENIH